MIVFELMGVFFTKEQLKESKAQFATDMPLQDNTFAPCPCSLKHKTK